ncbi:serine/threonine-protein kinase [Nesterenkonia flava]|uniref:Serine/threonine-protein kinase n=1 Tax=Nesterenkonia flava TaxID=469799 RepID=A0ABU1FQ10_9MICC|nr:serine/threonine-protein kinase [Nesterenkonia flava]MDR5710731.1 serine/threonine-protein kinase [Nesterenkonia flava]
MGDVFAGRYELVDPLGEGGAGVVWRVWDRQERRYCAAKVLRQTDAASLLRFMREQSFRLDHPHVLAPTGWAGENDKVLFTMPIARGGSVDGLVGDFGPLPEPLVALLLDQLLAALEAIHAQRIVHRDVKPANLLLDATGQDLPHLWLSDFGIAAGENAPRLTQGPFAMGTPGYTAPECLQRGWEPDASADVYAAGMCAVEMLTGLRPQPDTDARAALASACGGDAGRQEPVSTAFTEIIAGMTHPEMGQRTGSAAAARAALREAGLVPTETTSPAVDADLLGDIEVFDHLPPLPEGWTADGPVRGAPLPPEPPAPVPPQRPAAPRPSAPRPMPEPPAPPKPPRPARPLPPAPYASSSPAPSVSRSRSDRAKAAGGLVLAGIGLLLLALAILLSQSQ